MAAEYVNGKRFGALIFFDRRNAEIVLEAGQSRTCDIDEAHPPIKAWLDDGLLKRTGEADVAEQARAAAEEAAALEAQRIALDAQRAADAQAGTIEIITGDPRPLS